MSNSVNIKEIIKCCGTTCDKNQMAGEIVKAINKAEYNALTKFMGHVMHKMPDNEMNRHIVKTLSMYMVEIDDGS